MTGANLRQENAPTEYSEEIPGASGGEGPNIRIWEPASPVRCEICLSNLQDEALICLESPQKCAKD